MLYRCESVITSANPLSHSLKKIQSIRKRHSHTFRVQLILHLYSDPLLLSFSQLLSLSLSLSLSHTHWVFSFASSQKSRKCEFVEAEDFSERQFLKSCLSLSLSRSLQRSSKRMESLFVENVVEIKQTIEGQKQ